MFRSVLRHLFLTNRVVPDKPLIGVQAV